MGKKAAYFAPQGKHTMKKACLALLFMLGIALTACGPGNNVKLLPPPPIAASSLPPPNAPSVSVVAFKDSRSNPAVVGVRRDGSDFTTTGDVATWISRALADDLARKGFRVTYATDALEARNSSPTYLVTGTVDEVWLKENSAMDISAQMRMTVTLANRAGKIWTESCGNADNLLLSTLNDLIAPVANKIVDTANSK